MITVITESGQSFEIPAKVVHDGTAAIDAYVAAERKKLGLPVSPPKAKPITPATTAPEIVGANPEE